MAILAAVHYGLLLHRTGGLLTTSNHGLIYNSMALYLLEGRFDVDPAVAGDEAFIFGGRTYAYFGILPAIFRLPLVPFLDLTTVQVEGPYRLAAMLCAAAGSAILSRAVALRCAPGDTYSPSVFLMMLLFSGPVVMIGVRGDIFNEATMWAWAFAIWFLALLLPALGSTRRALGWRFSGLALLAACAVLTRATTGLGLLATLAFVMLCEAWREVRGQSAWRILRGLLRGRFVVPTAIALAALAATGMVNYARWGNPFTFADVRTQLDMLSRFPDRLERIDTYGLFNVQRLGLGVIYYFVPIWMITYKGQFLFQEDISRLFDAFELPPSSFFLSDPLTMVLAGIGLVSVLRQRIPSIERAPTLAAAAGLSVPPCLMLIAWYMAFRYRAEFMPLFVLLAALGSVRISHWIGVAARIARRRAIISLSCLLLVQIVSAHLFGLLYLASPWGPSLRFGQEGIVAHYERMFTPR